MIGGIVGRYLDVREANLNAEAHERNHARLLQEYAEALGKIKRLEKELDQAQAQLTDFRMAAADGDTRRLVADNSHLRVERVQLIERAKVVVAERDAAVVARKVAENALALRQVAPVGDEWKRRSEQDRANALALSDALCELRESTDKQIAELREQLAEQIEKCGREHPS